MQTINLGAEPDDGTGDSARVAGGKINGNFDEVIAALAGKQPVADTLTALGALVLAAGQVPYATGPTGFDGADSTDFGRALLAMADAADARDQIEISAENTPFTPAGTIAASDVQTALAEVDSGIESRVAQQIANSLADVPEAEVGTDDEKLLTPETGKASVIANAKSGEWTQDGTSAATRTINTKLKDWLSAADFGTTTAALNAAATEAMSSGKKLIIPKGDYTLSAAIGFGAVAADIEVICEPRARFIAGSGFPVGDMVQFTGAAGKRIIWRGGYFDGSLMPNSGVGESNDMMSFNLSGAALLLVEDVEFYCGDDFTAAGSDSGLFAGWATRMIFNRIKVKGAPDAGIYLSGGAIGDGSSEITEDVSFDDLTFDTCNTGLIFKRRFKRVNGGRVFTSDCVNGVSLGGEADTTGGASALQAEDVAVASIVARRTGVAAILRFADNARIGSIVSRDMGCKVGSHTDTVASAVLLQGAQRCHVGSVIADGENSAIASLTSIAARAQSRTVDSTTRHSTDNFVGPIISRNIDRSVQEDDANQNRNVFETGPESSVANIPSLLGPASVLHRLRYGSRIVLAQSAVSASVTGTTSETTLATITVPGGALGANGRIVVTATWTCTNSANAKTMRTRFGGSAFNTIGVTATASLRQQTEISNRGSTGSQVAMANVAGGFGVTTGAVITAALDTTVSRDVTLTATLANTGETITLESYIVELMYAP